MYGTTSKRKHELVSSLRVTPIDYRSKNFVERIHSLMGDDIDVVFDWLGGKNMNCSYRMLCRGG